MRKYSKISIFAYGIHIPSIYPVHSIRIYYDMYSLD